jgi:hypothetical protein
MDDHSKEKIFSKRILFAYLKKNIIITGIAGYYVIALILYLFAEIDILIPCLWKTIFNVRCPGCGLTRAFINLLSFDIAGAWASNPLIFIIFPGLVYYVIKDFIRFVKNNKD